MTPFQHGKLLAQCQILEQEALARAKEANEGCEADAEESKHGEQLYQNAAGDDGRCVIDSRACRSFGEPQATLAHPDAPTPSSIGPCIPTADFGILKPISGESTSFLSRAAQSILS
jgi:hypothetical protein